VTLCGVRRPLVLTLIFRSDSPGVEEREGASPDFVELAGVGSDCLVDRRGGIMTTSCGRVVWFDMCQCVSQRLTTISGITVG